MRPQHYLPIFMLIFLSWALPSFANTPVDERFLNTFIRIYKNDPEALQRFQAQLINARPEDMDKVVHGLETNTYTYLAPVIIPAVDIPQAQGLANDTLTLMAIKDGKLKEIPFQIDEYDETGLIWVEDVSKNEPEGAPGHFDGFDELVFMFRDAGLEPLTDSTQPHIISELTLNDAEGQTRYAYLVKQAPSKTFNPYISVDMEQGQVRSTVFELDFNPKNLLDVETMVSKVGPEAGQNLLGDLNVKLSTGILSRTLRFSLEVPNNIRALPLGVKDGPVRSTVLIRARVWYMGMPTLLTHPLQVQFYEQATNIPIPFDISSISTLRHFVGMLKEPKLDISLQLKHTENANVTFANVFEKHQEFARVDGQTSSFEQLLNAQRMPGDWLSVDSNKGWGFLFSHGIPVTEDGLFDQYLEGTEINMVYKEPRINGAPTLELGFQGKNLPMTVFDLLKAAPTLPKRITELGDAFLFYEEQGRNGKLHKYDEIVHNTLKDFAKSNEQLTEAFITDMGRMQYVGMKKEQLNALIRAGLKDTLAIPDPVDHGKVLTALVAEAKKQGVDWADLRFANIPITFWFPHKLGTEPHKFHQQQAHGIAVTTQPWQPIETAINP